MQDDTDDSILCKGRQRANNETHCGNLPLLSAATGNKFTSKTLWENTYAFLTDAATVNLKVKYAEVTDLGSSHTPMHVLCKLDTCEKLDEACLRALIEVETIITFADIVTKHQPQLRSFIRQSKCVALTAFKALIVLSFCVSLA